MFSFDNCAIRLFIVIFYLPAYFVHLQLYIVVKLKVYGGYYTVARRYEFYVRVARTSEILFLPREPTCDVLFIICMGY